MCAGAHENGQVYSQALSWDGRDLVAAIENTTSSGDFKLHIAGTVDQACSASLNGQAIEIEEALVLFCDESAKMPKPKQLVRKPGMRAGR